MVQKFYHYLLRNQVIFALVILAIVWAVIQLRGILVAIFIAYILMAALIPLVNLLTKHRFPKILAVLIPYVSIILLIFLLVVPLIQMFVPEVQSFLTRLPLYLDQSANLFGFRIDGQAVQDYISREVASLGRNAFTVTSRVFSGVFTTISVMFISFYFLMYHEDFKRWLAGFFHKDSREQVIDTLKQVDDKLGAWVRGQLTLSFSIGFMTWAALSLLGVPYALPLAVIAGALEILPTLGPTIAAIPAVIVALTISPGLALTVGIVYIVIQQLENTLLVPKIMQRAVGFNPVVVIISIMIGSSLMGVVGALLSIPFLSFILILFNSVNEQD